MEKQNELKMTYSAPFLKNGTKTICIYFERGVSDYAEGVVPSGQIIKSSGFTPEELSQLSVYLQDNAASIINKAKEVNFIKNWLADK